MMICQLLLAAAVAPLPDEAAASDARLIESLKSFIPHVMRQCGTPGLSIALARRGRVIWEDGFGFADLASRTPMTAQTVMRSGSMGKTYTATAVMQLVEQGALGLDHAANEYLTEFKLTNPLGAREITVRDLLTHRSGLTSNTAGSTFDRPKSLAQHLKEGCAEKMFESYQKTLVPRWTAKVGEKVQYSNFGIAMLGYLVEVTNPEHLSFSDYVQRHIIDPLEMTSTQFPPVQDAEHIDADLFARLSTGYARLGPVHLKTPPVYFAEFPAGAVVTTTGDHIRLLLAYLADGKWRDHQLLAPETVRQMLAPQVQFGTTALGLVWFLRNEGKLDQSFGHAGAHMFGWNNEFRAYPRQDFAVVVATNHWDMLHWGDSEWPSEPSTIAEFISAWLQRESASPARVPPRRSWAWKTSYVMGLIMVERLNGGLGIDRPLSDEMVDAMIAGVDVKKDEENGVSVWDAAGFRAGVADLRAVKMVPQQIRAFLSSDRLQVSPEELEILYRELGGSGQPISFLWLDAQKSPPAK